MGCKGSKTAPVASKAEEQPAGENTLLQEPAAEVKTETPQESATPATTAQQDTAVESPAGVPVADAAKAPEVAEASVDQVPVPADTTAVKGVEEDAAAQDDLKPIVEQEAQAQKQEIAPAATTTIVEKVAPVETPAAEMPEAELPKVATTSAIAGLQGGCVNYCTTTEAQSELVVTSTVESTVVPSELV